jgi:hypothetical protein
MSIHGFSGVLNKFYWNKYSEEYTLMSLHGLRGLFHIYMKYICFPYRFQMFRGKSPYVHSWLYTFPIKSDTGEVRTVNVCAKMFLDTLAIDVDRVATALQKATNTGTVSPDQRGKHGNHFNAKDRNLKLQLLSTSHYSRQWSHTMCERLHNISTFLKILLWPQCIECM